MRERRIENDEMKQMNPFAALEKAREFYLKCERMLHYFNCGW
jgi:hypothetical protein